MEQFGVNGSVPASYLAIITDSHSYRPCSCLYSSTTLCFQSSIIVLLFYSLPSVHRPVRRHVVMRLISAGVANTMKVIIFENH